MKAKYGSLRLVAQVESIKNQVADSQELPFKDVFSSEQIQESIDEEVSDFRDRVFPPDKTLMAFIRQCISSDKSCRAAVAAFNADRIASGLNPASSKTSNYCRARERLPERLLHRLAFLTATKLETMIPEEWKWKGRNVKLIDGTSISLSNTTANQKIYPPSDNQKKSVGNPIARCVAVLSLGTGCLIDLAMAPWAGEQTGEHGLCRRLFHCFDKGDIAVADSYYDSYFLAAFMHIFEVDTVFRMHNLRRSDFRQGRRLGKHDHLVKWRKPTAPKWIDQTLYELMPEYLEMREVLVRINIKGFRTKSFVITTSLKDSGKYSVEDLADLYRQRWHAELDLRSIKTVMGMEFISSRNPAMVKKEVLAHMLAYNLIRRIIAVAAEKWQRIPREISFKGTIQTLLAYQRVLFNQASTNTIEYLLSAIVQHRVGDRPDRSEPRAIRSWKIKYPTLKGERKRKSAA